LNLDASRAKCVGEIPLPFRHQSLLSLTLGRMNGDWQTFLDRQPCGAGEQVVAHRIGRMR
jgi:hypothetical protein